MPHERVIYTGRWFCGSMRYILRDLARSIAFGLLILLSFVFLIGIPWAIFTASQAGAGVEIAGATEGSYGGAGLGLLFLGFPLCVFCWWAALEVADDRHWDYPEIPTIWDEYEARWIRSTVAFAQYLESRGEQIQVSLVRHDDPQAVAHTMIEHLDERTIQLYLSLLSAMHSEIAIASARKTAARVLEKPKQ
ncbi:MAG: hypothetical protein JW828_01640 [Sedimentisphaerales bacterium]|nr:hypothetical protein [Sedimentisphaerales bacterium]